MGTTQTDPSTTPPHGPWSLWAPAWICCLAIGWTALYVNHVYSVKDPANYRFFPPYQPLANRVFNEHLGAENFEIAKSVHRGDGFASPFRGETTGPTAWMPPALPSILTALLWVHAGDQDDVIDSVVALQTLALMAMAIVVLAVALRTTSLNPAVVVTTIAAALLSHFYLSFQVTHDCWLNLATLTAILAGLWFGRPLRNSRNTVAWGLFGGFTALVGPILGATWAVFTVAEGVRERSVRRLLLATVVSIAVVTPWAVRNYRVFDRFIPVKSNLAFELHQSQILEPDGVLRAARMPIHPYPFDNAERKEYKRLGEIAYLDGKMAEWKAAVVAAPWSFVTKIGNRFLAATLWYVPLNAAQEQQFYWGLWISRVTHALPFLAAMFLAATAWWLPLRREQKIGLLVYAVYLTPYVLVSYYDRYAYPLMVVKIVLVVWAIDRLLALWPKTTEDVEPIEVATLVSNSKPPQLHRWVAGAAVFGLFLYWYGGEYIERCETPKVERYGNYAVVPDFFQEWYSARLWWEGRPVYEPTNLGARRHLDIPPEVTDGLPLRNAHPPGAVLLALPFGGLSFEDAFALWSVVSLWLGVASVGYVMNIVRAVPGWMVLPSVTLVAVGSPFWAQWVHGQLNLVLLPVLVGAWAAARSNRPGWAGVLVGVAGLVKLFPLYLLVYFVLTGRWRAALVGTGSFVFGVLLSSLVLGYDVWQVYFTDVLPVTKEFSATWANVSLTGLWLKLFDPSPIWPTVRLIPIATDRAVALALAGVTVIVVTAVLARAVRGVTDSRASVDRGFAAALVAMLLVSPVVWEHYFLLLPLPVLILLRDTTGWRRSVFAVSLAVMSVFRYHLVPLCMYLVGEVADQSGSWDSPPWLTVSIVSLPTWSLLTLFVLLSTPPATTSDSRQRNEKVGQGELILPTKC